MKPKLPKLADVVVANPMIGLCHMSVCCIKQATKTEILRVCNAMNPSGTKAGWGKVYDSKAAKNCKPVKCEEYPNRVHKLVAC